MAGPTPVSALIHAATMVTAGVYLCCRMFSVFELAPEVMLFISITGAVTLLVAGFASIGSNRHQTYFGLLNYESARLYVYGSWC